ncbi:YiiX/YebB-like N1pC/P60 family cysteine hydrolase [Rothia sp. ZJ932]|uniref:YiiX/YebB-like N1pC/P60 family cysteine hydrolase n=1 Tax=Rothia sp. ZJ932 TaxID=2810516 RepID=UPI0019688182|nr:YiiX/YebB-like N1pC/P60 family cysteine hydrolase [Rothia sp. ZJ932]QRZ61332.1 hypothetical protein JR346_08870 [Rothia sp. ZJ932]
MRFLKVSTTAVLAVGLLMGASAPGIAQSAYEQNVDYLVTSVGVPADDVQVRAEVVAGLEDLAQSQAISVEQAAQRAADEYRSYAMDGSSESMPAAAPQAEVASGGGRTVALQSSKYIGDIFYSSNSTAGIPHGHNGIYYTNSNYVEAEGYKKFVRTVWAGSAIAPAPAYKYYVGWDKQSPNKIKAANFALRQVGKPYNGIFFLNKTVNATSYNCSQLVWAAYKSTDPNVDLDSNGGPGVYPTDIAKSSWVTLYETRF